MRFQFQQKYFFLQKEKGRKSFLTREILQLMVFYLYRYTYSFVLCLFRDNDFE